MILDALLLFSTAQNITSTAVSTNVIDLQNARDMGIGDDPALKVLCVVTTAFTSTDGTLTIGLQGSTDNSTFDTYASTRAMTAGMLTTGAAFVANLDWPAVSLGFSLPRYLRLNYTVANAAFTPGALTATLVADRQDFRAYARNFTVTS